MKEIYQNKTALNNTRILKGYTRHLLILIFTYGFISLIQFRLEEITAFLPFFFTYLIIYSLYFLTQMHTQTILFDAKRNELVVIRKSHLNKMKKITSHMINVDLSSIADSYGSVVFYLKLANRKVRISSYEAGLSRKKAKKIYKTLHTTLAASN